VRFSFGYNSHRSPINIAARHALRRWAPKQSPQVRVNFAALLHASRPSAQLFDVQPTLVTVRLPERTPTCTPSPMVSFSRRFIGLTLRAVNILRNKGVWELMSRSMVFLGRFLKRTTYNRWIAQYDTLTGTARQQILADIAGWKTKPLVSLIMTVGDVSPARIESALRSLRRQLYANWELCIGYDASISSNVQDSLRRHATRDKQIRLVLSRDSASPAANLNLALSLACGEFIALIGAQDELAEQALYAIIKEIAVHPDAAMIFSDEDKIDRNGKRFDHWFKSDWNPALMLSQNAFGNLGVYRRSLVEKLGGFRFDLESKPDYDLLLRCASEVQAHQIRHVTRVLYHRYDDGIVAGTRTIVKSHDSKATRSIEQFLAKKKVRATVTPARQRESFQVEYAPPSPLPRVSILVPSTGDARLLGPCLQSVLGRTTYDNFEILVLISEKHRVASEKDGAGDRFAATGRVRLLTYVDRPFNYSWVTNWGASQASGTVLCLLNDDTEVISPDWLTRLVARVSLPGVAAAGPILFYPDNTIQHAGVILGLGGVAGHACHGLPRRASGYAGRACLEQDVSCITAACMVIRAALFREFGGLDEKFAVAYNDVDLCLRLREAGWRIIWTPTAELFHRESASTGRHDSPARAGQFAREVAMMRERWGAILDSDPYYNSNLSLQREFELAFPPRHPVMNAR